MWHLGMFWERGVWEGSAGEGGKLRRWWQEEQKCHMEMPHGSVTWKCHMEMPHIHEIQTWWFPHDIPAPGRDSLAVCDRNTGHNVVK